MRGDRTVHILREPEKDWQGDPVGEPARQFVADDCTFVPSINQDDGQLVNGQARLVIYPGAEAVPGVNDEVEIQGEGVWQIDGDVVSITKRGEVKIWMMNLRKQR